MLTEPDAVRLLRQIRTCLVVIAFSCIIGVLILLFPEYSHTLRIGFFLLIVFFMVATGIAGAASAITRAASSPRPPTTRPAGAS